MGNLTDFSDYANFAAENNILMYTFPCEWGSFFGNGSVSTFRQGWLSSSGASPPCAFRTGGEPKRFDPRPQLKVTHSPFFADGG